MIGKTLCVSVLAAVMILAGASISLGLSHTIPNDEKWDNEDAPEAFKGVVNRYERVYGYGGDSGIDFYFKGDVEQLNAFLAQLAEAKNTKLTCTLVPDPGLVEPSGIFPDEKNKPPPIAYTWAVHMPVRMVEDTTSPSTEQEPAQDADGKQPGHDPSQKVSVAQAKFACGDLIRVVVPIHGAIELDKLVLPLAYEAHVGGRLGDFADGHNQRREFAQEPYAQPKDRQPTTQAILDSRGFFGASDGKENSEGWQELIDTIKKNLSEQSQEDRKDAEQSSENKPE